jgi:hypothetical protein
LHRAAKGPGRSLPLPFGVKLQVKNRVFRSLPWLFFWTRAYRRWKSFNANGHHFHGGAFDEMDLPLPAMADETPADLRVPRLQAPYLEHKPARLICFYLPQLPSITENDACWWEEGYTVWTNLRPSKAFFRRPDQPEVPDELANCSRLDPSVLARQIELARLYGIEGYCFYFYWNRGKRLLEGPIECLEEDKRLDFPYCLCWANEIVNRRWDGQENAIFIARNHSAEDDLAFISHVARYLTDPRYIRIKGRPLLLVSRPDLLSSPRETIKHWRCWCRNNGIGDIFLACAQSFETQEPVPIRL